MRNVNDIKKSLVTLDKFFKKNEIDWMVNAGFSLKLRGFGGDDYDIDIVLLKQSLKEIFNKIPSKSFSKQFLTPPVYVTKGYFDNERIVLKHYHTNIDVCSKMVSVIDGRRYKLPFDEDAFDKKQFIKYEDLKVPVVSLEDVFIYKFIHNRYENGKEDINDAIRIIKMGELDIEYLTLQSEKLDIKKDVLEFIEKFGSE